MNSRVTLLDLATALGVSTGTIHRALHNHEGVSAATKAKVLETAKGMGYRPNLAGRILSSRRNLRVSVITLKGTTSFWDEVRAGISEEAESGLMENVDIDFRTYPQLDKGDEEAFKAALDSTVDGIIVFPSRPKRLRPWLRRASRLRVPVVCVATDAPETSRLAVVAIDALASGSLAADLMGRFLKNAGKVAVTLSDLAITEHSQKRAAFEDTLHKLYPKVTLLKTLEDHDIESEAYEKSRRLFQSHPDLRGIYITTEASIPVIRAARDAQMLENLTFITTDLFPKLVNEIRSNAVAATIYQRPRTQGRMAFRVLREFLAEGRSPASHVTLAPHLVMRGNLDFFLARQSAEPSHHRSLNFDSVTQDLGERIG